MTNRRRNRPIVPPAPRGEDLSPTPSPQEEARLRPRPHVWAGTTYRVPTPVGTAFVTVNSDAAGDVREVFVTVGRAGSDIAADAEALGRLISLLLRIPSKLPSREVVVAVIDQLAGIGGSSALGFGPNRVRSLADAVGQVLAEHCGLAEPIAADRGSTSAGSEGAEAPEPTPTRRTGDFCPNCGEMALVNEEGCQKCYACGYSSC
jgi:ribonucleoside-diphosphate reductase alpha chain